MSASTLLSVAMIGEELDTLVKDSEGVMEDMKLYAEALEKYCAELDKTLWDAIELGKKRADAQYHPYV